MLSLFSKAFVPPETSYVVTLSSRVTGRWRGAPPPGAADDGTDHPAAAAVAAAAAPIAGTNDGHVDSWLGWRRSELLAAAAAARAAAARDHMVTFHEEFLVSCVLGAGRARELAVKDPYRALKLQPFVTVACKVRAWYGRDQDVSDVPPPLQRRP